MSVVLETDRLGKRYRRRWALTDCTLAIPAGRVVGLVGPNGAGKSTLLNLAAGLLIPSVGTIDVLGAPPAVDSVHLGRVGFVAQDAPTYSSLSVGEHLRLGARLNSKWDGDGARQRVAQLGLGFKERAGSCRAGSAPNSHLRSRSPNSLNCSSSMSPSQVWTHWRGESSCSTSWRLSRRPV